MQQVVLAGLLAFALASLGASPAAAWLDAGELGAAGYELGVMHPPGMPGLAALLQLATVVPLGPVGFRMALVSSAAAAIAVALTMRLLQRRGVHPLVSWGALAWLVCGLTFLRHARGVEIYAPQLAALAYVADGFDPARPAHERLGPRLLATFVATWAIWGFAELRLLLPPLLLAVWISALRRGRAYAAWAPVVVTLASACIFALPLSAAREPTTDWGDPSSAGAMIDHLLARSIRVAFADEMLPHSLPLWLAHASAAIARLGEDLGPSGPVLGAVALVSSWVGPAKLADRRALATVSAWGLGSLFYAVGINPMGGVDRQTGLVLAWCVVLLVVFALDGWLSSRGRVRLAVLPVLWTVLIVPAALGSVPDAATMRSWGPHAWTRAALEQLPPRTLLLTQSDDLSAGLVWAQVIEGARPDVLTWPGQHLHKLPPAGRRAEHAALWQAVVEAPGEAAKIEAAIAAHDGPVALEHAGSGVFAKVRWSGRPIALPLSLSPAPTGEPAPVHQQIAAWLPWLSTEEDRRRLAVAIAEWARGHVRRGGELGEAIAALQSSLVDVDPHHVGAMVTLGSLFDRLGDGQSAIEWTRRALGADPTRQVTLLNLALYLSRDAATRDEAEALCRQAIALRPWKPEPWLRLAEIRAAAGDVHGAEAARQTARGLVPSP